MVGELSIGRSTVNRPVRKKFGRYVPNPLTRMGPAPGFGRPASAGFGVGSVGWGGSVAERETPSRPSTCRR